jgi:hypothetical protein
MTEDEIRERIVEATARLAEGAKAKGEHGYSIDYDLDLGDYRFTVRCNTDEKLADVIARFESVERFPNLLQITYYQGMIEGISTYRREIARMGMVYEKAYRRGDELLNFIERDLDKVLREYPTREKRSKTEPSP